MTITAKIVQGSRHKNKTITTFELEYPRFIHSEVMTHRLFSRNSASSRAIPIDKMNQTILENPAFPIHWGKNQPGMQAKEELPFEQYLVSKIEWDNALRDAANHSAALARFGAHKQISNRLTEPFQHMKVVMTTTELSNWFWLRDHTDAQPEIAELAKQMRVAVENYSYMDIKEDEWHVPYITRSRSTDGAIVYSDGDGNVLTLDVAKMVSASCCAQVSYRKLDDGVEKAIKIYKQLIESEPCHASPVEHQATPIKERIDEYIFDHRVMPNQNVWFYPESWQEGITHVDRKQQFWSGNFNGWIQNRQLIPNNSKW